ncbi:MAG TPA: hypothetical protein VFO00_08570 [Vitreimonas sp.]|nr:hypothetical protein [Vitreimonas sp.]
MRTMMASLALALAAACGPTPEAAITEAAPPAAAGDPLAPVPADPLAGPSGLDSLTWIYDDGTGNGSGRPRLLYSARSSDELGLNLQCAAPGVVEALIVRNGPDVVPTTYQFTLQSGVTSTVLTGATQGEPASEMFVRASVPASDPVLVSLRDTGRVSVTDNGRTHVFDAIEEHERQTIRQFFAACL